MPKTPSTVDISGSDNPESWLPIRGFEGFYEVSDLGRVRSLSRVIERGHGRPLPLKARILKQPLRSGYPMVSLAKYGVITKCYVHRLVLTAFCGEPAPGMEVCHGNDIRTDNRLENLRWDTHKANVGDAIARGRHRCISEHNPAGQTHCQRGHPFDEANTVIGSRNRRSCRECRRLKERERYHKAKAA